jgi:hypothetical protein
MSADNGIYILKMKDQSRVGHFQAIENLWWSNLLLEMTSNIVSTRVMEYYFFLDPLTNDKAEERAFELEKDILEDDFCYILEYGIQTISINKTWDELVKEAKILIKKEIKFLNANKGRKVKWQYEIDRLELLESALFCKVSEQEYYEKLYGEEYGKE